MARKRIHSTRTGMCVVSIYRDSYAGEYVVTADVGGKRDGGKASGGYFTDNKADARNTAASMLRKLRRDGRC